VDKPLVEAKPLPPKEAMAFWADKVPVTKREWKTLEDTAKARAFTVAGLARGDLLDAVHVSMGQVLEQGQTFATWKKSVAAQGLAGLGFSDVRLETIFRTNLQSAYQAGRYAQMRRATEDRPYWRYTAVNDSRTRPTHRGMHGLVYPAEHPFWGTYYPPNGYRCRCSVQSLSARQVEARGIEVQTDIPEMVQYKDPTTGFPMETPLYPDQGFAGNVGRDWFASLSPEELDGVIGPLATRAVCRDGGGPAFAATGDACRPPLADLDPRHVLPVAEGDILPAKGAPADYVSVFLREFGLNDLEGHKLIRLPGVDLPLVVSKYFFIEKATGNWKTTWTDKGPYVRLLARTILSPYEIWQDTVEIAGERRQSLRLIRLFRGPGEKEIGGYCAFHLIQARSWASATAFAPKSNRSRKAILEYLETYRAGTLIYREP
jgi:SPP1 gp7 family putative phage head morphogenesis protein